jgi:hypothetical protein
MFEFQCFDGLLSHLVLLNFARHRHRKAIHKQEVPWHLEPGHLKAQIIAKQKLHRIREKVEGRVTA